MNTYITSTSTKLTNEGFKTTKKKSNLSLNKKNKLISKSSECDNTYTVNNIIKHNKIHSKYFKKSIISVTSFSSIIQKIHLKSVSTLNLFLC